MRQGRPKDGPEDKFRLNPVVPRLQELLGGAKVSKADDSIGPEVAGAAKALGNGEVGHLPQITHNLLEVQNPPFFAYAALCPTITTLGRSSCGLETHVKQDVVSFMKGVVSVRQADNDVSNVHQPQIAKRSLHCVRWCDERNRGKRGAGGRSEGHPKR